MGVRVLAILLALVSGLAACTTTGAPQRTNGLIGPGKAIDTNRYFVVSSNMLGSSYGSTAPASINPVMGKRYGPDFPAITVRDIVEAQRLLRAALGVNRLVAVAGPSYGDAKYVEIDSDFGHSASGPEWAKWGPALKAFLASLEP